MAKIKVVATGKSDKDRNQKKGKLFEKIVADILRVQGYTIDEYTTNVNYSGMEIDIEGKATIAGTPMYAECKCYSSDVSAEKLQTFFGKYMTRWFKDNKSHGLFIALPGVNSHALGFYKDNCESNNQITVRLIQENKVIDSLVNSKTIGDIRNIQKSIDLNLGTVGDSVLVYSEQEPVWVQYLIPHGSISASKIILFDSQGRLLFEQSSIDYILELLPELSDFEIVIPKQNKILREEKPNIIEEIVEIRGSSSCFEYQFPASPEFFVGRDEILESFTAFSNSVISKETSFRNILFEANSGWGKSSAILACVKNLLDNGHFAIAIDSRSASSPQFILRTTEYVMNKFGDFDGIFQGKKLVTGFEGAITTLIEIGRILETNGKILLIIFDQFENIFYLTDLLDTITQMCLKISDANSNVILGFAWKTDLIGLTREFPYRQRDIIIESSKHFPLKKFTEKETNILLDKLSEELHAPLRKDLRFLLSEFSQGYPWLLKKLCAHVKKQRASGILQAEIARGLLNVEELFNSDLNGLSSDEEHTLKQIAKLAPVSFSELGEDFNPDIIQSLIHRRLIVKVGTKYDIYWDIFRDYLNTGNIPTQEHYMLRAQVGSVLKAVSILRKFYGRLSIDKFQMHSGISEKSFHNIARDLLLLDLAKVENSEFILSVKLIDDESNFDHNLRERLRERLWCNQVVRILVDVLNEKNELAIDNVSEILIKSFGYISANKKTWSTYAKILMYWLDVSDIAILDSTKKIISVYKPGSEIRDRKLILMRKRGKSSFPHIQFQPVYEVASRINQALSKKGGVDWSGLSKSTLYKALSALEDLNLIAKKSQSLVISPELHLVVNDNKFRKDFVTKAVLDMEVFTKFLILLEEYKNKRITQKLLGKEFCKRFNLNWSTSTAEVNIKIMLDWARHLELAPGIFSIPQKGRFKKEDGTNVRTLFD